MLNWPFSTGANSVTYVAWLGHRLNRSWISHTQPTIHSLVHECVCLQQWWVKNGTSRKKKSDTSNGIHHTCPACYSPIYTSHYHILQTCAFHQSVKLSFTPWNDVHRHEQRSDNQRLLQLWAFWIPRGKGSGVAKQIGKQRNKNFYSPQILYSIL